MVIFLKSHQGCLSPFYAASFSNFGYLPDNIVFFQRSVGASYLWKH